MAHNVYINIILTADGEEFPNEYGVISQVRKQIKEIVAKDKNFKMKRYSFDIIDEELESEDVIEFEED